jgi:hypothetical protein
MSTSIEKMKTRVVTVLSLLLLYSGTFAQKRDSLLFSAYKSKSVAQLKFFFESWANEVTAIADQSTHNDTIKNVYLVFQAFYDPKDISKSGGSEWGNDIYKNADYLLVQDRIYYGIVDSLIRSDLQPKQDSVIFKRAIDYDTLKNFRPQIIFSDAKAIPLTRTYDSLLNRFLGNHHYKIATGNIMSPARSKGESEKRKQFLENYIKIWYGHWGGYWQLYSYPYVSRITFDRNFQNAIVDYRMVYEGGYAYLKNINGNWTIVRAKRTWIE